MPKKEPPFPPSERTVTGLRTPPYSAEAEQSVLGGLMLDNQRWDQVADRVSPEDFYRVEHQKIFRAVASLCDAGSPADVVTVSEWLEKNGDLETAGGLSYLGQIANNTPSAANIVAYADIVRERAVLRRLIRVSNDINKNAYTPEGQSAAEILDQAEKHILDIRGEGLRGAGGFAGSRELLTKVVDRVDYLSRSQDPISGVPTGFIDLDQMTCGLHPGELVIVAGRPSMGKTAFAMGIAEYAILTQKEGKLPVPVAVFSMEMPAEQLMQRMVSSVARVHATTMRTGKLGDDDWPRFTQGVSTLRDAPIYIDDTPALTPFELRSRARRLKREHGLGLIIVDYLQLMQSTESGENRATEISAITRSLKTLAKELGLPVIALSQLNRSLEQRPNKRPVMSDLRESGAIEQDADVIFFIYRDEVYNEDSQDRGTAEIIIGKQRNGPIGKVRLTFLGEYTRFENHAGGGGEWP